MKPLIDAFRRARAIRAKKAVLARPGVSVHQSAKVNWRGLSRRPPANLSIGQGSIFEGTFTAERDGTRFEIGDNTFIGSSYFVSADRITIGNDVLISWGCTIIDHHSHSVHWSERQNDVSEWYHGRKDWSMIRIAPIEIGDRAWIGFNAIVLAGIKIGEGAVVGCGSIVTRDVPPHTVVAGNPAKVIRELPRGAD